MLITMTKLDYYYFATAGGARIWVCDYAPPCRRLLTAFAVEEIPYDLPDCTVRH